MKEAAGHTPISGVVMCFNEADNIARCLASLAFCDEIVVVDSFSTDATVEIAKRYADTVVQREFAGYIKQREFAVSQASHDWIVALDADEEATPELATEIRESVDRSAGRVAGFELDRITFFLGKRFDRGAWYPDWEMRVFDRRRAVFGGREPHDRIRVEGPVVRLDGRLNHFNYRDLSDHIQTLDRFSTSLARTMYDEGRRATLTDLVLRPLARFLKGYVAKQGFRKGVAGLCVEVTGAYYVFMKYAKLWELQRNAGVGES